jgi:hypothetical protein
MVIRIDVKEKSWELRPLPEGWGLINKVFTVLLKRISKRIMHQGTANWPNFYLRGKSFGTLSMWYAFCKGH